MTLDRFASVFDFYIHIDKKSELKTSDIHAYPNVHVYKNLTVNWGGFNHLKAFIDLMNYARRNDEYDFYHLITGQDIVVGSKNDFDSLEKGKNYINSCLASQIWGEESVTQRYHFYRFLDFFNYKKSRAGYYEQLFYRIQKKCKISRSSFAENIYGGSTYCSLSSVAVNRILQQGKSLLKRMRFTFIPEEIYFQTFLENDSILKETIVHDCKRLIIWPATPSSGPRSLDIGDLEAIQSGKYLFARKIDVKISAQLIAKVYG